MKMANEKRLIELELAIAKIKDDGILGSGYSDNERIDDVCDMLESCPTVDAVEVVHSRWDTVFYERNGTLASYSHLCPVCKYFYRNVKFTGHNFCPNCGAKMDGDGNG
jgi:hypothetical protein